MFRKGLMFLLIFLGGCVSPNAMKVELATVRDNFDKLEKIVDNKVDTTVIAKTIENFRQEINQNLLSISKTINNSGSIKYGSGGWIVLGTGIMAVIFIGAGFLFVRAFINRGSSLTLLTHVVQKVGEHTPEAVHAIKEQLKIETSTGGSFTEQDRKNIGYFARKKGTFAEQKSSLEV